MQEDEIHDRRYLYDQKSSSGPIFRESMKSTRPPASSCVTTGISASGTAKMLRSVCFRGILKQEICTFSRKQARIHAAFAFIIGADPCYTVIEQGEWKSDAPYAAVHRVASDGTLHNVIGRIMDFAKSNISHIRIDTHEHNKVMQKALEKQGFERCGIIYVPDGTPRIAFEWMK